MNDVFVVLEKKEGLVVSSAAGKKTMKDIIECSVELSSVCFIMPGDFHFSLLFRLVYGFFSYFEFFSSCCYLSSVVRGRYSLGMIIVMGGGFPSWTENSCIVFEKSLRCVCFSTFFTFRFLERFGSIFFFLCYI